jgi:hypothetical protein
MINTTKTAIAISLCFVMSLTTYADDIAERLRQVSLANINALIILTSQNMLTSGSYGFKGASELTLYNFPLYHHFQPVWDRFNIFINGSVGYSSLEDELDWTDGQKPNDHIEYQALPLRFGGGVRYAAKYDIHLMGGFNIIYSKVNNIYDYNTPETESALKPLFDSTFANQRSSAYTYEMFWQLGYSPTIKEWKPYIEFESNYFQSTTDVDITSISKFKSSSVGARLILGCETPRFIHLYKLDLSTEVYIANTTFAGDVRDTLGFDEYGSAAVLIHVYLNKIVPIISRIDLRAEKLNGGGLDGYNFGIGAGASF